MKNVPSPSCGLTNNLCKFIQISPDELVAPSVQFLSVNAVPSMHQIARDSAFIAKRTRQDKTKVELDVVCKDADNTDTKLRAMSAAVTRMEIEQHNLVDGICTALNKLTARMDIMKPKVVNGDD